MTQEVLYNLPFLRCFCFPKHLHPFLPSVPFTRSVSSAFFPTTFLSLLHLNKSVHSSKPSSGDSHPFSLKGLIEPFPCGVVAPCAAFSRCIRSIFYGDFYNNCLPHACLSQQTLSCLTTCRYLLGTRQHTRTEHVSSSSFCLRHLAMCGTFCDFVTE